MTLQQLNPERKTLIIMALYKTKLITTDENFQTIIHLTSIQLGAPTAESD
jgi:hypothetical protein